MKAISITEVGGETEIEVETGRWIFKHVTTFRATERIVGDYFTWVKMPNRTMTPDWLSFQLDSWKKSGIGR